jgi:O-Antigen ligase
MPTATTVPLLVLIAVLWRLTNGELLSIVLFVSMFGAASALNFGGSGVTPWIFALVVGGLWKLLKGFPRPRIIPGVNITAVRLLAAFIVYSVWTGMIYPFLFHGVPVYPAHNVDVPVVPLSWGTANAFQILYLMAVATLFLLALSGTRKTLDSAIEWYVNSCVIVSLFAIYQLASATLHVPYPSSVLYSNPGYVIYPAYKIGGMWRLNSTHTEASAAGSYLSIGIALQGWKVVTTSLRWRSAFSLLLMLGTLFLTQSSTGYLAFIFTLTIGILLYLRKTFRSREISRKVLIVVVLGAIAGSVLFLTTSAPELVNKAIHSVLLDKKDSSSYRDRTASQAAAMQTARDTYYMGAGWGSVRSSGLKYQLLGTVGIPGFLLFCLFLGSLFIPLFLKGKGHARGDLFERSLFGTAVCLVGLVAAGAEPVSPILWALFAACSAGPYLEPHVLQRWNVQPNTGGNPVSAFATTETRAFQQ